MMSLFRPRALVWSLVFAFAVSLPFYTSATSSRNIFFFEVTVSSSEQGVVQLFYDIGRGVNEQDSVYQPISAGAKPTTFRFGLQPAQYRALRFDPINRESVLTIADARIIDKYGKVIRRFGPGDFSPTNQIASTTVHDGVMEVHTTPAANDPSFAVMLSEPLQLKVAAKYWVKACATAFLAAFLLCFAVTALPAARLAASRLGRIIPWAQAHPGRAVAVLSVVVVAIQCHPVIFFGKSFVSPDNGVLLLYDEFPVLPGYQTTEIENAQGSDVGALMFWHIYCPVVAHDAIFRDHELPLWNRYTMNGLPLLGQGQSMFGDPLNWLSIVSRSAAWSWDVRFVLTRWLLCCGLGLTALALIRHLPAALLVTIGGGFLGFFQFRLNHPANFSLGYSPWILFAWVQICAAENWRGAARYCLLLILANFAVMTSGTLKEAYMLIACLNFAGVLLLFLGPQPLRRKLQALGLATASGVVYALVSAPLLASFFDTLKLSWTSYDTPSAQQTPPAQLIGFFDDLFYRQFRPNEIVALPAANFLFLLGVLWSLVVIRDTVNRRSFVALGLAALVPLAIIYSVVPAAVLTSIPFIANISHLNNTFSCPLIILAAVLAGFGFEALFKQLGTAGLKRDYLLFVLLLAALAALYFGTYPTGPRSGFFTGYVWSMILALLVLPIGLHFAKARADASLFAAILLGGIVLTTWRHSQYLHTPFDDYVVNPQVRANLHAPSAAAGFVDSRMKEPSRPIAFGLNLFSGYNQMLGWESILGVDPLRNRYQDELASAFGLERVFWADHPISEDRAAGFEPGLDLLNVRYYLAVHTATPHDIAGLTRLGQFDLDVYESPTAWPRAFFTDRVGFYESTDQFAQKVNHGDRQPFAMVQGRDRTVPAAVEQLSNDFAGRTVRAASNYHLTANTTAFDVTAPTAGIVVLGETYMPGVFRVTVNGEPQDYFRVNHASRAVYVGAPGTYHIEYAYWPPDLTITLLISALGFAGLAALGWLAIRRESPGFLGPYSA